MKKALEEGQIVLCTVDRIAGTVVFVNIDDYGYEGAITFSEISPGRIRNIRDFVSPGKKIACKVLRVRPHGIDLSLRRVKLKEKNELNEENRREKSFFALLKTIVKEGAEEIMRKIKESGPVSEFIETAREDVAVLEKYIEKASAAKIISMLQEKKSKETVIKRAFSLSSKNPDGMTAVKEIIKEVSKICAGCEVSYVAAGKYLIKIKTANPKQSDSQIDSFMEKTAALARQRACIFSEEK